MSLATTGGAGGGLGGAGGVGGLTMGHDASGSGASALVAPPPPSNFSTASGPSGSGSGGSASLPTVEVCDKTQKLSLNRVKAVAHWPIAAVDLHAAMPTVALFPPVSTGAAAATSSSSEAQFLGKMKPFISFRGTETAHKTLRKFLTQAKPYSALKQDVLTSSSAMNTTTNSSSKDKSIETITKDAEEETVVLDRPHLWLGLRRINQMDRLTKSTFTLEDDHNDENNNQNSTITTTAASAAIAQDPFDGVGSWWTNSTLEGTAPDPQKLDHDLDRVACKIRLHSSKKALTILPEEGTQMILHQARSHVATRWAKEEALLQQQQKQQTKATSADSTSVKHQFTQFPVSVALPAWAFHDAYIEALYEAIEGVAGLEVAPTADTSTATSTTTVGVMFLRSVAALTGSLMRPRDHTSGVSPLLQRLAAVQKALRKLHLQQQASNNHSDKEDFDPSMTIVCVGTTPQGCEVTAIQVSEPQNLNTNTNPNSVAHHCPFGSITVLANVSQLCSSTPTKEKQEQLAPPQPAELLPDCLRQMNDVLDMVAPEVDGPAAVLTYGTTEEQKSLVETLKECCTKVNSKEAAAFDWIAKVPVVPSPVEAIANGTALLGGIALGRSCGSKSLPVKLQTVATVATGVAFMYGNGGQDDDKESKGMDSTATKGSQHGPLRIPENIKVIFDFDRRLPAGPYSMEFKAAECVVHAQRLLKKSLSDGTTNDSDHENEEEFIKAVKDAESSKRIPDRERAALNFRVQIYQKWTRGDSPWQPVGNPIAPLVKLDTQIDEETDQDKEETKIGCEQVAMELSMAVTGVLATAWAGGERESIVQAMKSKRGKLYEYYGWLTFAILFFGGFFVKSYWEDYVWKRDTQRLLDYYAHVIPGSLQDGDYDTASWLAYKYRHNKAKLWQNLETKYGVPVPENGIWPADVEKSEEEGFSVDKSSQTTTNSPEDNGNAATKKTNTKEAADEPDELDLDEEQEVKTATNTPPQTDLPTNGNDHSSNDDEKNETPPSTTETEIPDL